MMNPSLLPRRCRCAPASRRLSLLPGLALLLLLGLACQAPSAETDPNRAAFVTRLGADTLAVEQFVRTPERIEATVVLRTPTTTLRRYVLDAHADGTLRRFEGTVHDPSAPADAPPLRRDVATIEGDSLRMETTEDGQTRTYRIAGDGRMLPFLDMIHWPFELMLTRAYGGAQDSLTQDLFTGRNALAFVVRRLSADSMTVTHPFRGTMGVRVDAAGRLVRLDAGATTRKLVVTRVPAIDVAAMAQTFAARDAQGRSFGPLSTRGQAEAFIDGATIRVDYGVPSKRGRTIFGALVPWGTLWRTGANRATHFATDRDLQMGDLQVPVGEYTLYTIPEPSGGTLIINRQTGQGGTTYHEDRDLGRVAMTISKLPETVETFTIGLEDTAQGGVLTLQWDRTAFAVPFTVQ